MSETVYYAGKLKPVAIINNIESTARNILIKSGIEIDSDTYDSYIEQLEDELYKKYVVVGEQIFQVDQNQIDAEDDIFEAYQNQDGTINFTVKYYDGGSSFNEAIEESLANMKVHPISPGDILVHEFLVPHLAKTLQVDVDLMNDLASGKGIVTQEIAKNLVDTLGHPLNFG